MKSRGFIDGTLELCLYATLYLAVSGSLSNFSHSVEWKRLLIHSLGFDSRQHNNNSE